MKVRRLLPWASAVLAVAGLAIMALSASAAPSKSGATAVRVAIVTDIGGLNDKGFNQLSNVGLQRAIRTLDNVSGRAYITNSANDRTSNLRTAAQSGFGLVIPGSCIAGVNNLTVGFASSLLGACGAYWLGIRSVLSDRAHGLESTRHGR